MRVNVHDFPGDAEGKAIPYGVYDIGANTGWVSVGTDHETAAFAVNTLRTWWNTQGRLTYPGARRLLITADSGGSNGSRRRAWKTELAALAAGTGLEISVCHLPPGTSKWPARYRPLPDRRQGQRPGDERPPDHPRPLAWRVELHAPSRTRHSRAALT